MAHGVGGGKRHGACVVCVFGVGAACPHPLPLSRKTKFVFRERGANANSKNKVCFDGIGWRIVSFDATRGGYSCRAGGNRVGVSGTTNFVDDWFVWGAGWLYAGGFD